MSHTPTPTHPDDVNVDMRTPAQLVYRDAAVRLANDVLERFRRNVRSEDDVFLDAKRYNEHYFDEVRAELVRLGFVIDDERWCSCSLWPFYERAGWTLHVRIPQPTQSAARTAK